jgi:5,10-methylenetetrahydromethanopterin reductase
VLVQASAIATLESLAPGRTVAAIGTGFTGRQALGQKALPWRDVEEYIRALQALLRGETVEVEGAMIGMIPAGGTLPQPPIDVPILVAANGPKGLAVAEELGDGVMTVIGAVPGGFEWCAVLAFGTVLEEGESPSSERALAAAAPGVTVVYHAMYGGDPTSVDALPGGAEWRAEIEKVPEEIRHLTVHAEHMVRVSEHDRPLLATAGDLMSTFTYTGTAKEVRARIDALETSGVTELLYAPMGPDVPRELRAFASMAGL